MNSTPRIGALRHGRKAHQRRRYHIARSKQQRELHEMLNASGSGRRLRAFAVEQAMVHGFKLTAVDFGRRIELTDMGATR